MQVRGLDTRYKSLRTIIVCIDPELEEQLTRLRKQRHPAAKNAPSSGVLGHFLVMLARELVEAELNKSKTEEG